MDLQPFANLIFWLVILTTVGVLYRRYDQKWQLTDDQTTLRAIQQFLNRDRGSLEASTLPILWIHIPYEYNARQWESFGSRSSMELNQPYLFLTVRSILQRCQDDFTICIVDDRSFAKLLPAWEIDLAKVADPLLTKLRQLGMMKLLRHFGGMLCPLSFVCMRNLRPLHDAQLRQQKEFFVCETVNRGITSCERPFAPSLEMCGAPKGSALVEELCQFLEHLTSRDATDASVFLDQASQWCLEHASRLSVVSGHAVGTQSLHDDPVLPEHWMARTPIALHRDLYGAWIPHRALAERPAFRWITCLSEAEVLKTDTFLGNCLLLALSSETHPFADPKAASLATAAAPSAPSSSPLAAMLPAPFIAFWKVPSRAPVWGVKPMFLGDSLRSHHGALANAAIYPSVPM